MSFFVTLPEFTNDFIYIWFKTCGKSSKKRNSIIAERGYNF